MTELLKDTKAYRDALRTAFTAGKQGSLETDRVWSDAHFMAGCLIIKYGPATYARMDNIAYGYC